jgi:hypothetical protein
MKKKVLLAMLAVALVFGMTLAGCKDESGDTTPPDSIEGIWAKGSFPKATFTETDWELKPNADDTIRGTYTYSDGTATLTPSAWVNYVQGGTATASGNKMTIVIRWTDTSMGASTSYGPLTKQ